MPAIQIRNVPEETRRLVSARARAHGQSMQQYLYALLEREAGFARNHEILEEIAARPPAPTGKKIDIEAIIDAARARADVD